MSDKDKRDNKFFNTCKNMDNDKNMVWLKYALIAALIFVLTIIFLKHGKYIVHISMRQYRKHIAHLNTRQVKKYILSYGKFAFICYIIIYSLKPILFIIPTSLLSILAGNIFGPYIALLLSMISSFFAGTIAYGLAKLLGRSFVEKILKGKALTLDDNIEKHGFKIMLLMRLSFVFPYDALSYAAGLTKMKYSDFIFGTMLGILPEMICYSFMGKNLGDPLSIKFILPIILIILIALIGSYAYKLNKKS